MGVGVPVGAGLLAVGAGDGLEQADSASTPAPVRDPVTKTRRLIGMVVPLSQDPAHVTGEGVPVGLEPRIIQRIYRVEW